MKNKSSLLGICRTSVVQNMQKLFYFFFVKKGGSSPKGTINTLLVQNQEQVRLFKLNTGDCCIYFRKYFPIFSLYFMIKSTFFVGSFTFLQKEKTKGVCFLDYISSLLHLILQTLIFLLFCITAFLLIFLLF